MKGVMGKGCKAGSTSKPSGVNIKLTTLPKGGAPDTKSGNKGKGGGKTMGY